MNLPLILGSLCAAILIFALMNKFSHWRSKRWRERTLKKITNSKIKREPSDIYVMTSDEELSVRKHSTGESKGFAWKDVVRIVAFKRDLFAYDCVCVAFELDGGGEFEIDEEMDGFGDAMDVAAQSCQGCIPYLKWFWDITVPAFETKLTELYRKEGTKPLLQ